MGLDTVELALEIETAFGIDISDADASRMITPGHIIDHVEARIGRTGQTPLPGMRAFYRIRRACLHAGIGTRHSIRPQTSLSALFPRSSRRADWPRVGAAFGIDCWPRLQHSRFALGLIWAGSATAAGTASLRWFQGLEAIPMGLALWGLLAGVVFWATRGLRSTFPNDLESIRDLVGHCLDRRPLEFWTEAETLDRGRIARIVKTIVCRYCDPGSYREDAHIVRDLGLD